MVWIVALIMSAILLAMVFLCLCRMADDLDDNLEQEEWYRKWLREKEQKERGKDAVIGDAKSGIV